MEKAKLEENLRRRSMLARTKSLSVKLRQEVHNGITQRAEKLGVTPNTLVNEILEWYLQDD